MVDGNFQIYGIQMVFRWMKTHLQVKKLNLDIFTRASPGKALPLYFRFIPLSPRQRKLLIRPQAALFWKSVWPHSKRGYKYDILINLCQKYTLKSYFNFNLTKYYFNLTLYHVLSFTKVLHYYFFVYWSLPELDLPACMIP